MPFTVSPVILECMPAAVASMSVVILQDEVSTKSYPAVPEGVGNPGVHIVIVRRRSIIGNDGRSLADVVVGDLRLIRIDHGTCRSVCLSTGPGAYRYARIFNDLLKSPDGFIPVERQQICFRGPGHRFLKVGNDIRCDGVVGDPTVSRGDTYGRETILCLCFVLTAAYAQGILQGGCKISFPNHL